MRPQPHDWRENNYGFICLDCGATITCVAGMQDVLVCPISYDRNWAQPVEVPCTKA